MKSRMNGCLGDFLNFLQLVASLICSGTDFHKFGSHTEKSLSANLKRVRGSTSLFLALYPKSLLGTYD